MKFLTLAFVFAMTTPAWANGLDCGLERLVLTPTRDMVVSAGNDSRGGDFNTTIVRNKADGVYRGVTNRLATRLKSRQAVELIAGETRFRIVGYEFSVPPRGPGFKLSTGNRAYLFYCGECYAENRRPKMDDLLNLIHEDGEPFFEARCATLRPKARPTWIESKPVPPAELVPAAAPVGTSIDGAGTTTL